MIRRNALSPEYNKHNKFIKMTASKNSKLRARKMNQLRLKNSQVTMLSRRCLKLAHYESKKERVYLEYQPKNPDVISQICKSAARGDVFEIDIYDIKEVIEAIVIETKEIDGDFTVTFRII